jgi:hypothetical protein
MEAILHPPIDPVLKFMVLNGKAKIGKNCSIPTNINVKIPATVVVIKAAKLHFFMFKLQFAPLTVIFTNSDPINAIAVTINGIVITEYCRNVLMDIIMNTDAATKTPIIEERDNLKSVLDISLKYSWFFN